MKKSFQIGSIDEPSYKGARIYPREIVAAAIEEAQESIANKTFFVSRRSVEANGFELIDIIGIVRKLYIVDTGLFADIEFIETPAWIEFQKTIQMMPWIDVDKIFTSVALGNVQESFSEDEPDTVTDDYKLIGVCAVLQTPKKKDSERA